MNYQMNYRNAVLTWLSSLALLGVSLLSVAFMTGVVQYVINLTCAVAIAALMLIFYMRLRLADGVLRTFALAGLVWLAFLLFMTVTDVMMRHQF